MLKPVTVPPMWLTLFDLVSWLCEVRIETMLTNFQSLNWNTQWRITDSYQLILQIIGRILGRDCFVCVHLHNSVLSKFFEKLPFTVVKFNFILSSQLVLLSPSPVVPVNSCKNFCFLIFFFQFLDVVQSFSPVDILVFNIHNSKHR